MASAYRVGFERDASDTEDFPRLITVSDRDHLPHLAVQPGKRMHLVRLLYRCSKKWSLPLPPLWHRTAAHPPGFDVYLATFVAEIPPRLLEAKERAEQAWAKEAEVLGDKIYELPAYVAALREAQRRSILNCYENDVGYQVALKEELAHWGITPEEFFADRRLGGEMADDACMPGLAAGHACMSQAQPVCSNSSYMLAPCHCWMLPCMLHCTIVSMHVYSTCLCPSPSVGMCVCVGQ